MISEQLVRDVLKTVKYPGFSRDIVAFGLVRSISVSGADVNVVILLETRDEAIPARIYQDARAALDAIPGIGTVTLDIDLRDPAARPQSPAEPTRDSIPGVRHVIAVASGKGGVGKSTVSSNLAVSLASQGLRVGLLDCDLYGPSMALMFGINEKPYADEHDRIIPKSAFGVQVMSMAFLLDDDSPVVVRGPLATRYIQQFLRNVAWDNLDVLILDLPPGTGDIQLTIVQTVPLDGAVIVTTPQEVALIDARKAVSMFHKVNVPILGLIENMSWFECPSDGKKYEIFGQGGGIREAQRLDVPLLGQIPIEIITRESCDRGTPVSAINPEASSSKAFASIAAQLRPALS